MVFTWMLGLIFVSTLVYADRTQQEVSNDPIRRPVQCSSLKYLKVDPKQLEGDWMIKQSLFFYRGVIIFENEPDDDFQHCFEVCMKINIQVQDKKLAVHHITNGRFKNISTEDNYDVFPGEEPGTFRLLNHKLLSEERHLVVVSGDPSSYLIVAHCKSIVLSPEEAPVQVLDNLNLLSRQNGRRGQSVFTVQELEAQVEMFKSVGLSEAQWSVPYDTTC